jgi:hypothetical protein
MSMSSRAARSDCASCFSIHLVPCSLYTALRGLLDVALSTGLSFPTVEGVVVGVLASGRPAKGLLRPPAMLGLLCTEFWGAIVGMLLLCDRVGRSLLVLAIVGVPTVSVSERRRLPNLEGGGGREPTGRVLFARRSFK